MRWISTWLLGGLLVSSVAIGQEAPLILDWGVLDTTSVESRQQFQRVRRETKPATVQRLSSRGTVPWLVQFNGLIREEWKTAMEASGAEIRGYMPENGFVVLATPAQIAAIGAMPDVVYVGEFLPEYKRAKAVRRQLAKGTEETLEYNVWLFRPEDRVRIARAIAELKGAQVTWIEEMPGRALVRVILPSVHVEQITGWGEVEWVEPYLKPQLWNDISIRTNMMGVTNAWSALGLTGAGQTIAVCDTGLDTGNPGTLHRDFTNRVTGFGWDNGSYKVGNSWADTDSHGTHVSGSVLGNGTMSTGRYRGVAYEANLIMQGAQANLDGIPANINTLFKQAFDNGARIHSDSWGYSDNGAYHSDSLELDQFVWSNKTMLVLVAAGNQGIDANSDGIVDLDSIGSPATAKNCLSIGAAENYRNINSTWGGSWPDDYPAAPIKTDKISMPATGDIQGMAAFSSRGPCDDGRIKPDIVAPGTYIISTRSRAASDEGWGVAPNTNYLYMGGTSMATPLTAGAAALARQWVQGPGGIANPSAALLKALLISGARNMAPGQYGTGSTQEIPNARPSNVQGWGHVDLYNTLVPAAGQFLALYDTESLSTGQNNTFELTLAQASSDKFILVLAYSDYWGTVGSGKQLVNDLDIRVQKPSGGYLYPNSRTSADRTNNVEMIEFIPNEAGTYLVTVTAYHVPSGGSQPYALVIRGPQVTSYLPPAAPDVVWASQTNITSFTAAWSEVADAESYRLDVATNNAFSGGGGDGGRLLEEGFASATPSGWTFSGVGTYSSAPYVGTLLNGTYSIKFDTTGDSGTTPTFASGATNLQFWSYGNGSGTASTFTISGLVNSAWALIDTVSIASGGGTYNVPLNPATTQLGFYFAKNGYNCALDDVIVQAGGSAPSSYVPGYSNLTVSGTSQEVSGLSANKEYFFRVRTVNDNGTSVNSPTGSVTTLSDGSGTPPTVDSIPPQTATVGVDFTYEVSATEPNGDPFTFNCSSTVDGSTWDFDANAGYFYFAPTSAQIGQNVFAFTATDKDGTSSPVAMTVTVSAAAATVSFGQARVYGVEGGSSVTLPVVLSSAANATVQVAISGTALPSGANADFSISTTTLVFSASGPASLDLELTIGDDALAEGPESARLQLNPVSGAALGSLPQAVFFLRDNDAFSIVAANLTSGDFHQYEGPGTRILQALCPDVVLIQEFLMPSGTTYADWVSENFGPGYSYFVESTSGDGAAAIPNGIVSRWPIDASGEWSDDANVNNRDFAWATIDVPGPRKLHAVSVHFLTTGTAEREAQARTLTNYVANAGWNPEDYLVVGGDLNTLVRTEPAIAVLTNSLVSDAKRPKDQNGDWDTNVGRTSPYDYVLPGPGLHARHKAVSMYGHTFNDGMVFDTRLTWANGVPPPALAGDSGASGMQHMGVVKVFELETSLEPPTGLAAIPASRSQIDLVWTPNAAADEVVVVWNTDGNFTVPSGTPPAVGESFAGGYVLSKGTATSTSHSGLEGCSLYSYRAWSHANGVYSSAASANVSTEGPSTPGLPWASETNNLSFVAAWEEVTGADSYRLDVSESESFGSGAGTSYTVNFDGSGETKPAYTYSLVSLGGKNWGLTEALIGDSSSDWKNGVRSARMRGYAASAMTLLEDLPGGLSSLAFNYRRYGSDAQVDWKAEYSTDGGSTWTQIGSAFTAPASDVVQSFSASVNVAGNVRVRIVRATNDENASSNYRLNIDDIVISSLAGSYVEGYENLEVASGTSREVTGLKSDTTYYFRVRAVERTCTSGNSPAGQVTTLSVPGPGIVLSSGSLDLFSTLVGSPSAAQSFTVAGQYLTDDILVTPPPGFEVSTSSGSGYGATVTLTPSAGTVDETDVYVRLTGAAKGSFSGEVEATSPGAIKRTKAVSGTVSGPEITLSAAALGSFLTTQGSPSDPQSFAVAGVNLTGDITVTPPTGFEVSTSSGSGYGAMVTLTPSAGTVVETDVYVRLAGTTAGSFSGDIQAASPGADPKTKAVSGVVASAGNVFTKITSLADMTDGSYVIVNSGDGFAMNSGNAGTYFTHTAVIPDNGVITNPDAALVWTLTTSGGDTTIQSESTSKYVTYAGSANAAYASDTVGSTGLWNFTYAAGVFSCANKAISTRILQYNASSPRFACYTTAQQKLLLYKKSSATPTITLSGTLNAFSTTHGVASSAQSFKVAGVNLTANITVSAPSGYQVSTTEGSGYANSVELTQSGGAVAETTVSVRLTGAATGTFNGNISAASTDATTKTLAVSGTVGLLAPTGLGAEGETDGRFTAFWNAVSGATGYLLDVSEYETFAEPGENAGDLFFSEYIEGSSNNKAIEIYNGTGASVDLSDYTVYLYANGSATPTATLALSGTLADGDVYVIANSAANATILALADLTSGVANYNGDDALSLWKESTSSYVDIFGRIGEDPGTVWTDGSHQTAEQTLVRKSSVSGGITANPSSGFPTLASEWDTNSQDTATYLGSHTFAGESAPSFILQNQPVSGESFEVTGLDPDTTYYFRVRATDGTATSAYSDTGSATTRADMNPTILLSTAALASFAGVAGAPSDPQTFTVAGQNLTDFIVVTPPSGFELSRNETDYDDTVLLEENGGAVEETTLYVRLTGEALGAFSGNISASSTDADTKTKTVEGSVGLAAPVATSASGILTAGFVANWEPVTGATGYRLDVSTEEFFSIGGGGLFISEVADPSDAANAKFVELYNASDAAIDFSTGTWYIWRQANGGSWANMKLTGTIQPDGTYVLAYDPTYDSMFNKSADQYSSAVSGNGDDGYFLVQGGDAQTMGTIVDAYGVKDQDGTGYAWDYLDKHAVRNATIAGPNATWTASEWTIPGTTVNAAGMTPGAHTCSGGAAPSFLDDYANRLVSGTSQAVSELSPNTRYYYRSRATADAVTSGNSSTESAWTLAQTPLQPTITTNNGTIWILINDDGNPAYTQYKIRRLDANTYLTASATWQEEAVWRTRAEWNPEGTPADTGLPAIQARSGSSYAFEITAKNGGGVETEPTPTRVVLFYFTVGEEDGFVVIRWRTASEANTVGFWLERRDGSRWVRINSSVIYAAGEDGLGAAYSVVDAGAAAGGTYTYRLVEVETGGTSQIHGPYERTASALRLQSPITVAENGILIRWLGRNDERYTLLRSTNLLEGLAGFRVIASGLPADPEGNEFLDEDAPGFGIYLIQVDED